MNRIVLTKDQRDSLILHGNNFGISKGYSGWTDYMANTIRVDFLPLLNRVLYDLDYFTQDALPQFWLPESALDSPEFDEFKTYLLNTLSVPDLNDFFTIQNLTAVQEQNFHKLVLEFRTGSDQQGYTINGNEITLSDVNPLPLLGMSLVQTINALDKIEVEMRFKIEKTGLITLGYCNVGIGEPSSNNASEIKYCISMVDLSDVIHYGVDADNLTPSSVTHNNANWYGIAYTDENSVVLRYSADNCATWTVIHTFEDVALPGTLRALFDGQVALEQGQIQIKGPHIVAWAA